MKLSLALASTFGLLFSQGQGVLGLLKVQSELLYASTMSTVVLDGDGCANLDCGTACYELSDSAKAQLTKISKGNAAGDLTKVPSGQFWKLGVCNKGGQCVPDVAAAANSCDDPVNEATVFLATNSAFIVASPEEDPSLGFDGAILTALVARAVTAFGNLFCADLTVGQIVEAAQVALQALVITREASIYGLYCPSFSC